MFDKFGEFDSCEELNMCAEGLFNEGDMESLKIMAKENGIPEEYVQMYIEGETPELCDPLTAALGKLDIEAADLKPEGIMLDWIEYIKGQCMDHDEMTAEVRRKGKSLKGCIGALLKWSFGHQKDIDKEIIKAAGVSARRVTLGIPDMGQAKHLIRGYYMEGSKK